jgi:hypothetical protein
VHLFSIKVEFSKEVEMESEHVPQQEAELAEQAAKIVFPGRLQIYRYVVKFICGKSGGEIVAPGRYYTAINVQNLSDQGIRFRKRFSIALPGEMAGPVSGYFMARLGPYEALEIDCGDIYKHTQSSAAFIKGFAILESREPLEVVAVYTAAGAEEFVETLEIERVVGQRVTLGLPDLIPVPSPLSANDFCRRDENGNLLVYVKNQGLAAAPASTTRVIFDTGAVFDLFTPPISAGITVQLAPVPFPGGCFEPDCSFQIIVDVNGDVVESNEANNTAKGICIG